MVTNQLDDQVIWFLQLDAKQVKEANRDIPTYLQDLESSDPAVREGAHQGLMYYAHLSIGPLKKVLEQTEDGDYRIRLKQALSELRMWEDLSQTDSLHDLPFLLNLGFYPNSQIRRRARKHVVWLLSPSLRKHELRETFRRKELLEETLQWVRDHQQRLRWDPAKSVFVLNEDK